MTNSLNNNAMEIKAKKNSGKIEFTGVKDKLDIKQPKGFVKVIAKPEKKNTPNKCID